jgi:L-2-hydroxyglutarate oxidase LhgO
MTGSSLRASPNRSVSNKVTPRPGRRTIPSREPRLIMDALCTKCGPVGTSVSPWSVQRAAARHATKHGHVVILNGTVDVAGHQHCS